MPAWVLGKVEAALNHRGKAVKGSNVLVMGIAYKKDTSDTRESPGLKILAMLQAKGAKTSYYDPYVPEIPKLRQYELAGASTEISAQRIREQDCVVVCTDHSDIDYELIETNATLVVDTRNVFPSGGDNIVAA